MITQIADASIMHFLDTSMTITLLAIFFISHQISQKPSKISEN